LRWPQIRALETYWYLRLIEKTPHVLDLYRKCFLTNTELLASLGLHSHAVQAFVIDHDVDALWERIRADNKFSRENKLEALRETLRLDYPSYIFALAMGAGKTILIGTIIATEFAMALEYTRGPFVQNALVFAPGKTILESLRQLAEVPFDRILPPRLYKPFAASVKLTFTRDGEKDLPVIRGSIFNIVVTNTEKIRIQRPTARDGQDKIGLLLAVKQKQEEEIANLRHCTNVSFTAMRGMDVLQHCLNGQRSLASNVSVKVLGALCVSAGKTEEDHPVLIPIDAVHNKEYKMSSGINVISITFWLMVALFRCCTNALSGAHQ